MNRRNFLNSLIGGVATAAAVRTFPFRVFSFPMDVARPALNLEALKLNEMIDDWNEAPFKIGETITIRRPPRFAINPIATMFVDREVATIKSYDVQRGVIEIDIPGRSETPFIAAFTDCSA